jgi:hypothetical protein
MHEPCCDRCTASAIWSVGDSTDAGPITTWFACGRHLHRVLTDGRWSADMVELRDLREPDPVS